MTNDWLPTRFEAEEMLYLGISRAIERDIATGILKPGDILPTHRELADRLKVAIGTVTKAYGEAEKKSLIVGRGRKGTFVRSQDFGASRLSEAANLWSCDDFPVYTLPYGARLPDFTRLLKKLASHPVDNPDRYWPPESDRPEHTDTGVRWLARAGYETTADSVLPTMGNHHGLLVALANESTAGDTIASENHTFISLMPIAKLLHLNLTGLKADREGLEPEAFEAACKRSRIKIVYCQPGVHNPTNASMSLERRQAIVSIARKYGVAIVEDEVTRPLVSQPPPCLKQLAPDLCYLLASPSKVLTPGIKIGYLVPPPGSLASATATRRATLAFMGGLPSVILAQLLRDGTADKYIHECQREGRARQKIASELLPSSLVHTNPASYFVWLHLPDDRSAASFAASLYERGIPAWPAETYAVDTAKAESAIRFNIGQAPNQAAFKKSVEKIAALLAAGS